MGSVSGKAKPLDGADQESQEKVGLALVTEEQSPSDDNRHFMFDWLRRALGIGKLDSSEGLREAIEEFVSKTENQTGLTSIAAHERRLISNILKLRDMTVFDVMIPRADIVAIDVNTSKEELLSLLAERQYSRFPVYRNTLDEVVGTIHIKDILATMARGMAVDVASLVRDVPIVSPAMHVFDLILLMRNKRKHMVIVVDEYGGIDGLATIGDVIEALVGDIEDEYSSDDEPEISVLKDGSIIADGRYSLDKLQEKLGPVFTSEELEEVDTIAGLVFALAGHVPARGEILSHSSGMIFEVTDADPRRVNRVHIRNIPLPQEQAAD